MICTEPPVYLANKQKKTKNVLNGTGKTIWKWETETDGYGRDKRPEIEKKLKKKEITMTEIRKKNEMKKTM